MCTGCGEPSDDRYDCKCGLTFCSDACFIRADVLWHRTICGSKWHKLRDMVNDLIAGSVGSKGLESIMVIKIVGWTLTEWELSGNPTSTHNLPEFKHLMGARHAPDFGIPFDVVLADWHSLANCACVMSNPYFDYPWYHGLILKLQRHAIRFRSGLMMSEHSVWINHSETPNARLISAPPARTSTGGKSGRLPLAIYKATRPIKRGDEITINYCGHSTAKHPVPPMNLASKRLFGIDPERGDSYSWIAELNWRKRRTAMLVLVRRLRPKSGGFSSSSTVSHSTSSAVRSLSLSSVGHDGVVSSTSISSTSISPIEKSSSATRSLAGPSKLTHPLDIDPTMQRLLQCVFLYV